MVIGLESVKTRISAPAHPSATGIGRVSGLVLVSVTLTCRDWFVFRVWARDGCDLGLGGVIQTSVIFYNNVKFFGSRLRLDKP